MGTQNVIHPREGMHTDSSRQRLPPFSVFLNGWFLFYVQRYLRRHFHAVRLLGALEPSNPSSNGLRTQAANDHPDIGSEPVILYTNHPSWWDPLVFLTLAAKLYPGRLSYGPIDARALGHYRFMERIGFLGIDQGTWRGSARFLRMARAALHRSDVIFWITSGSWARRRRGLPRPHRAAGGGISILDGTFSRGSGRIWPRDASCRCAQSQCG